MADLTPHLSVYGPVQSWRFGQSLGIDPIGVVSTCSFNCVYCQLGEIEQLSDRRQLFVPTEQVEQDLAAFAPWDVDVVTFSGSGEPTLAQNLGELLARVKAVTARPTGVLTNGSLLNDPTVRSELAIADYVAVKVDAIALDPLRRVNRPVADVDFARIWSGLSQFRQSYRGKLAIQTMLLSPWSEALQAEYIGRMAELLPDEIQLNTPTRPKPLTRELAARGNHLPDATPYPARFLKPVSTEMLKQFGDRIESQVGIPVRHPPQL